MGERNGRRQKSDGDKTFTISGSLLKKIKFTGIGLLVGVLLGVGGVLFIQNYNPADDDGFADASVVFERIVSQNELVSVSSNYSITDKVTDSETFFNLFDIPFTQNSFWYRYVGTIKAGVNLETAEIEQDGTSIVITLDAPYIISNTPDMDQSGALEENNNILNPISVSDADDFRRKCIEESESDALAGGLLDEARTEAEANLTGLFYAALGDDYTVQFVWRDLDAATETE